MHNDSNENDFFYFLKLISPSDIVLDIGANIGVMTYHLSKKVNCGKVHSFEPLPYNFSTLTAIVKDYNLTNVVTHNSALGNSTEPVEMILPVMNSVKFHGLSHVKHPSITEFNEGEVVKTECTTLDVLYANTPVKAIKIDVENYEYFVLKGGEELLKKYHPIIYIELWDNQNRNDCFALFKQLGYSVYVVINNKLELYDSEKHVKQNFIIKA